MSFLQNLDQNQSVLQLVFGKLVRYGWVHVEVQNFVGVVGGSQAGGSQIEEKVGEGTEVVESTAVGMEVEAALHAGMEAEDNLEAFKRYSNQTRRRGNYTTLI